MKHAVATCAHQLATPQWMLVADLDASMELDATTRRSDIGWV
jgi:hypothetical protein